MVCIYEGFMNKLHNGSLFFSCMEPTLPTMQLQQDAVQLAEHLLRDDGELWAREPRASQCHSCQHFLSQTYRLPCFTQTEKQRLIHTNITYILQCCTDMCQPSQSLTEFLMNLSGCYKAERGTSTFKRFHTQPTGWMSRMKQLSFEHTGHNNKQTNMLITLQSENMVA